MPMLKRLRIRLVAIIVGLVGAFYLCMVALTYMSSEASLNTLVDHSLADVLQERTGFDAGVGSDEPLGMDRLPVIWVDIASGGFVLGTNQEQGSIDADLLRETVANALESGQTSGKDKTNHISWRMSSSKFGWRIAIADTSSVDEEISTQLIRSLELGAGGIVAIVLIALLLSHWALKPVERAWEQQRQFVADASHELKTPLSVILANTQILMNDERSRRPKFACRGRCLAIRCRCLRTRLRNRNECRRRHFGPGRPGSTQSYVKDSHRQRLQICGPRNSGQSNAGKERLASPLCRDKPRRAPSRRRPAPRIRPLLAIRQGPREVNGRLWPWPGNREGHYGVTWWQNMGDERRRARHELLCEAAD